jgi:FG-GAP-like repeat
VDVLLGNGEGSFQKPTAYKVGEFPTGLDVADLNNDGELDLVTANVYGSSFSVLLGNGDGSFQPAVTYSVGDSNWSVAVGDFNTDGVPDLAVTDLGYDAVTVWLGNGDGTFQGPVLYKAGWAPVEVSMGDFNRDGRLDLAVANNGDDTLSVLLGNGDGTFQGAMGNAVGPGPFYVLPVDLNGDDYPDLVAANYGGTSISVLLNAADWPEGSPVARAVQLDSQVAVVGDLIRPHSAVPPTPDALFPFDGADVSEAAGRSGPRVEAETIDVGLTREDALGSAAKPDGAWVVGHRDATSRTDLFAYLALPDLPGMPGCVTFPTP